MRRGEERRGEQDKAPRRSPTERLCQTGEMLGEMLADKGQAAGCPSVALQGMLGGRASLTKREKALQLGHSALLSEIKKIIKKSKTKERGARRQNPTTNAPGGGAAARDARLLTPCQPPRGVPARFLGLGSPRAGGVPQPSPTWASRRGCCWPSSSPKLPHSPARRSGAIVRDEAARRCQKKGEKNI